MKLTLLFIGKTATPQLQELIEDYRQRLLHYVSFSIKVLPELKQTKNMTEQQQKQEEGKNLLREITPSDFLVLLDERGKEYRSIELSEQLQKWFAGGKDLVFVVGGPYGFSKEVYDRADTLLSLSRMTFSHQMVRLFAIEQLYRSMTIIKGEKYHHE